MVACGTLSVVVTESLFTVAIGNPLPPLGVLCEVCGDSVLVGGVAVGVVFVNGDSGTGTGALDGFEEGGGVLGLGGRWIWGDFSGLGGWGAGGE